MYVFALAELGGWPTPNLRVGLDDVEAGGLVQATPTMLEAPLASKKRSAEFNEVARLLPKLKVYELVDVARRITLLRGTAAIEDIVGSDWLLDGIFHELRVRRLVRGRVPLVDRRKIAPRYDADSQEVREHLLEVLTIKDPTPVQLIQLGRVAAKCLAKHIETYPVSNEEEAGKGQYLQVGVQTMMVNVDKTIEAIDRGFPGYIQGGCLHVLLGQT